MSTLDTPSPRSLSATTAPQWFDVDNKPSGLNKGGHKLVIDFKGKYLYHLKSKKTELPDSPDKAVNAWTPSQVASVNPSQSDNRKLKLKFTDDKEKTVYFKDSEQRAQFTNNIQLLKHRVRGIAQRNSGNLPSMSDLSNVSDEELELPSISDLSLFMATWNMGNAPPPDSLVGWLPESPDHDMYFIGVQECAYTPPSDGDSKGLTCEEHWRKAVESHFGIDGSEPTTTDEDNLPTGYRIVAEKNLMEIRITLVVKAEHIESISNIQIGSEATGIAHVVGNKGGVAVSFTIYGTSLCLLGSHLAAHQGNVADRKMNFTEIIQGLRFGNKDFDFTNQFDYMFWCGDLNYRINMPQDLRNLCLLAISDEQWNDNLAGPNSSPYVVDTESGNQVNIRPTDRPGVWTIIDASSSGEAGSSSSGSSSEATLSRTGINVATGESVQIKSDVIDEYYILDGQDQRALEPIGDDFYDYVDAEGDHHTIQTREANFRSLFVKDDKMYFLARAQDDDQEPVEIYVTASDNGGWTVADTINDTEYPIERTPQGDMIDGIIVLPADQDNSLTKLKQIHGLLELDQLNTERAAGNVFHGFQEAPIDFPPTFKMLRHEPGYTPEKLRMPSWCDRILWKTLPNAPAEVQCHQYNHVADILTSDHRAVFGEFTIGVRPSVFQENNLGKASIVFSDLACEGLLAADMNGLADPYVVFHSDVLPETYKTETKFKTLNPYWKTKEIPILEPMQYCSSRERLSQSRILLAVTDYDKMSDDDVMGQCGIGLQDACGHQPVPFSEILYLNGEPVGSIRGKVHVKWESELKQINYDYGSSSSSQELADFYQYEVKKAAKLSGRDRTVEINFKENKFYNKTRKGEVKQSYDPQDLVTVDRNAKDSTKLTIIFADGDDYVMTFTSGEDREDFLYKLAIFRQQNEELDSIRLFVGTWNMGNAPGPEDTKEYERWINIAEKERADVYFISTQECKYDPVNGVDCEKHFFGQIADVFGDQYTVMEQQSMWEIRTALIAHKNVESLISNVQHGKEATGIAHVAGNKGGVAISFQFQESKFCFVGSHLAAHQKNVEDRKNDVREIVQGIQMGNTDFQITNQFDYLFWCGDLNFRIDDEYEAVVKFIEDGQLNQLRHKDQLINEMSSNEVYLGFEEGRIEFNPTYKMLRHESGYTTEKKRIPSWCDRVLWKTLPGSAGEPELLEYDSVEDIQTSDHRPVYAVFNVPVGKRIEPKSSGPCEIIFEELACDGLHPADANGYADPYVKLHAQFLDAPVKSKHRTKTLEPSWTHVNGKGKYEDMEKIVPFRTDLDFMIASRLLVAVVDHDTVGNDDLMGQCAIGLAGACGDEPMEFSEELFLNDQHVGRIYGRVQVVWENGNKPLEEHIQQMVRARSDSRAIKTKQRNTMIKTLIKETHSPSKSSSTGMASDETDQPTIEVTSEQQESEDSDDSDEDDSDEEAPPPPPSDDESSSDDSSDESDDDDDSPPPPQ